VRADGGESSGGEKSFRQRTAMHRVTRGPICRDSERLDRTGAFVSTGGRRPQGEIPGDTLNECPPETASPVCREHH
jgi:hypothetical protein